MEGTERRAEVGEGEIVSTGGFSPSSSATRSGGSSMSLYPATESGSGREKGEGAGGW